MSEVWRFFNEELPNKPVKHWVRNFHYKKVLKILQDHRKNLDCDPTTGELSIGIQCKKPIETSFLTYEILWIFVSYPDRVWSDIDHLLQDCNHVTRFWLVLYSLRSRIASRNLWCPSFQQVACLQTIILKFKWIKTQTSSLTLLPIALDIAYCRRRLGGKVANCQSLFKSLDSHTAESDRGERGTRQLQITWEFEVWAS